MATLINQEQANKIIENRLPEGTFYLIDRDKVIGIDNTTYDAWVEEFDNVQECLDWLRR